MLCFNLLLFFVSVFFCISLDRELLGEVMNGKGGRSPFQIFKVIQTKIYPEVKHIMLFGWIGTNLRTDKTALLK